MLIVPLVLLRQSRLGNRITGAMFRWILVCMMLAASIGGECGIAKAEESLEYAVKGAYLFKFSAYVEWPPQSFSDATAPFVIGILGKDPFGNKLEDIVKNRLVQGRAVLIKHYKRVDEVTDAHILYINSSEVKNREQINASLTGKGILTVTESAWGSGSIVNFIIEENKVRFEIDPKVAVQAGLKLSSKLLGIAKVKQE